MRAAQDTAGLVLIVEDNRNISEMVGEYLESKGFEVDYASDGLDGYRLAAENNYDVVVLDLMLPRLDGVEVCKRLRESEQGFRRQLLGADLHQKVALAHQAAAPAAARASMGKPSASRDLK